LDRIVYVPLPDASTRQEILEMQLSKMPVAPDVNISELVSRTERFSGAEVSSFDTRYHQEHVCLWKLLTLGWLVCTAASTATIIWY
jgi:hypothetical protein